MVILLSCREETKRMENYACHGIDVSHYQGLIDFNLLEDSGIDFIILKATEGMEFKDSLYLSNRLAVDKTSMLVGAYHYFIPSIDPEVQFCNFTEVADLGPGNLAPVLDVEITSGFEGEELRKRMRQWLEAAEILYGIKPIIYTYNKFYNAHMAGHFPEYPLWIARYHSLEPELDDGASWTIWQYGDRGRIEGIEGYVDFNVCTGSVENLSKHLIPQDSTNWQTERKGEDS